jgi:hypothetical protein
MARPWLLYTSTREHAGQSVPSVNRAVRKRLLARLYLVWIILAFSSPGILLLLPQAAPAEQATLATTSSLPATTHPPAPTGVPTTTRSPGYVLWGVNLADVDWSLVIAGISLIAALVIGVLTLRRMKGDRQQADLRAEEQWRRQDPVQQARQQDVVRWYLPLIRRNCYELLERHDELITIRMWPTVPIPNSRELQLESEAFGNEPHAFIYYEQRKQQFLDLVNETRSAIAQVLDAVKTLPPSVPAVTLAMRLLELDRSLAPIQMDSKLQMFQVTAIVRDGQNRALQLDELDPYGSSG